MDLNSKIEVRQSALSSLKSELVRKREECKRLGAPAHEVPKKKLKSVHNSTAAQPAIPDHISDEDDEEQLRKSRQCLQTKAKLYDEKRRCASQNGGDDDECLVDFHQKSLLDEDKQKMQQSDSEEKDTYEGENGDDSDWVEYVDFLGRTRKCLKEDLDKMKKIDDEFLKSTDKESVEVNVNTAVADNITSQKPEFLQKLHEEWEDQERNLREKQDIHYQDVFFNEARAHGVGYYAFSTDEEARAVQQAALLRLRQESKVLQKEAKQNAVRAMAQGAARIDAAKRRMLRCLQAAVGDTASSDGSDVTASILEPVKSAMETAQKDILSKRREQVEKMVSEEKSEPPDTLETNIGPEPAEIERNIHIRPWDEGKDGVTPGKHKTYVRPQKEKEVMSQEQWIEEKRQQRIEEFAPMPEMDRPAINASHLRLENPHKSSLFFTSKKQEERYTLPVREKLINKFTNNYDQISNADNSLGSVEPPTEIDLSPYVGMSAAEISAAVEAGLKYLRKKAEEKKMKPEKGLLVIE